MSVVDRTSLTAPTRRRPDVAAQARAAGRGLANRDGKLETQDGIELSGWYLPSLNGAAVIARVTQFLDSALGISR